jgi:hypothetical protein
MNSDLGSLAEFSRLSLREQGNEWWSWKKPLHPLGLDPRSCGQHQPKRCFHCSPEEVGKRMHCFAWAGSTHGMVVRRFSSFP